MKKGGVVLVGAGCGDAALLTLKGWRFIKACEVLVYDSLVSEELLGLTGRDCEKIYVGKRYGKPSMKQEEINALLIEKAALGKLVVRLKGGDPYVFGRGGEEMLALEEAGIPCCEVPGITSAIAAPAGVGIPVTHRGMARSVTIVTGTTLEEGIGESREPGMDFAALARLEGTLVILMGMHHLDKIAQNLMAAGKDPKTPAAVVMEAGFAGQRCVRGPLEQIASLSAQAGLSAPAVIIIGKTAGLCLKGDGDMPSGAGKEGTDFRVGVKGGKGPLAGLRVGVTGTPDFAGRLQKALEKEGAGTVDFSFLRIRKNKAPLPDLTGACWLVFTSPNGVKLFFEKMKEERKDFRSLAGRKFAVIGPGTRRALEEAGFYADYMPEVFDAAHLACGLAERILSEGTGQHETEGAKTFFLRSASGNPALPAVFAERRIPCEDYPLYELETAEEKCAALPEGPVDYIVFGSASGAKAWLERAAAVKPLKKYVCIGKQCAKMLAQKGISDYITGEPYTIEGVIACLRAEQSGNQKEE